jgi:LuxR family transcriptional regulator, quorum-sensing system regulator CviR
MYGRSEGIPTASSGPPPLSCLLSGCDAIKLLEFVHDCVSCEDERDFKALYPKLQDMLPFDFAHAFLGNHDSAKGIVPVHGVNVSFPEDWVSEFMQNHIQTDVVVKENFQNYKLQKWSDTKMRLEEKKEVLSLCLDFGMTDGYSHGVKPMFTDKNGSMFCFSGPSLECNTRCEAMLEVVVPHLHLALSHLFNIEPRNAMNIAISAREKEVLDWLKQGKTSWDISVILGISQRTVNFHVYNIMEKLGATNRPQAVAIATRFGLIDFN